MNWITMMVRLVTQSQTFWSAKSKWALKSTAVNKASGCDGIPTELLKSLKEMPSRFCVHYVSKSGRPSSSHRTGKGEYSSQSPGRVVPKNVLTTGQLYSSTMLVRSCLKSCMLGFSFTVQESYRMLWAKRVHGLSSKNTV